MTTPEAGAPIDDDGPIITWEHEGYRYELTCWETPPGGKRRSCHVTQGDLLRAGFVPKAELDAKQRAFERACEDAKAGPLALKLAAATREVEQWFEHLKHCSLDVNAFADCERRTFAMVLSRFRTLWDLRVGTATEATKPAEGETDPKAPTGCEGSAKCLCVKCLGQKIDGEFRDPVGGGEEPWSKPVTAAQAKAEFDAALAADEADRAAGGGEERVTHEEARKEVTHMQGFAARPERLLRYIEQSEREAAALRAEVAELKQKLEAYEGQPIAHYVAKSLESDAACRLARDMRDEYMAERDEAQRRVSELKAERDELVRLLLQPSAADSTGEIGKWLRARRYGAPVPPLRPQQSPSSAKVELEAAPEVDHLQAARRAADLFHQTLGPTHAAKALGHLVSHAEQQRALAARTPAMMTAGVVIGPQGAPSQTSFTLTEDEAGPSSQRRYESDYEE